MDNLENFIKSLTEDEKRYVVKRLRKELGVHPLESAWNIDADTILNAIDRSSDLTKRGIRGILAEASLGSYILENLNHWRDITPPGDKPYDYLIEDSQGTVRVQVKNQRSEKSKPKLGGKKYGDNMFIVETQKTRSGQSKDGTTRPYRFDEFDVLAVCLYPSTGDWTKFVYTVSNWLLPRDDNPKWIQVYQPVPFVPNDVWADDLETAIKWFRSGEQKRIWQLQSPPLFP
jgi:hypothetical protein